MLLHGANVIAFRCDRCGYALEVRDTLAGKRTRCPSCHAVISVPNPRANALAAQAAGRRNKEDRAPDGFFTDIGKFADHEANEPSAALPEAVALPLWSRPAFRVPVLIVLVLAALGAGGWAISQVLADRWEEENYAPLLSQYREASSCRTEGKTLQARQLLARLSRTLRDRSREHPLRTEDMIRLNRNVQSGMQEMSLQALQAAKEALVQIEPLAGKMPAAAVAQYDRLLAELADFDTPDAAAMRQQVASRRAPLAPYATAVKKYYDSFDPLLQQTIPFVRRLRWGMPAGMFTTRAPKIMQTWREIKDPPDRSSAGTLLSDANALLASLAGMQQQVEVRLKERDVQEIRKRMQALRPAEIKDSAWSQKVDLYLNSYFRLKCLGTIVRCEPTLLATIEQQLRKVEVTYRQQYALQMGGEYGGVESLMPDRKPVPARQEAFLDSFKPFLELALPTVRRLERGAERQLLTGRMLELDERYAKILDPPDDTDVGEFLQDANLFAEQAYMYSYFKRGTSVLDIVGQDQADAKLINDRADDLETRIQQYRREHK